MTSKDLRKIQTLLNKSIELQSIDTDSSLFISRKGLELLIHKFFEENDIEKKESHEEYPVLSTMIKKLTNEKYITKTLSIDMEFIRKKGNNAVHFTGKPVNPSIAKGSIQRLGKIIAWCLEELNKDDNTLFLYAAKVGKLPKSTLKKNEKVSELNEAIYDLCSYQIFRNSSAIWDITEGISKSKILDDEIKELIEKTERLILKFYKFDDEFVEGGTPFQNFLQFINKKKHETAATMFKKFYSDHVDEVNRLRKIVKNRYFAN